MASAQDFVERIDRLEGVTGCLLIRHDGTRVAGSLEDADTHSALMQIGARMADDITEKIGFSSCRHLCFSRDSGGTFHVFPIDRYLLGVVQGADCFVPDLLDAVFRLIDRVSTRQPAS